MPPSSNGLRKPHLNSAGPTVTSVMDFKTDVTSVVTSVLKSITDVTRNSSGKSVKHEAFSPRPAGGTGRSIGVGWLNAPAEAAAVRPPAPPGRRRLRCFMVRAAHGDGREVVTSKNPVLAVRSIAVGLLKFDKMRKAVVQPERNPGPLSGNQTASHAFLSPPLAGCAAAFLRSCWRPPRLFGRDC